MWRVFVLFLGWSALHAASAPAPTPKPDKPTSYQESGASDAKAAFARQAGDAAHPTGDRPAIIGSYVWGGRADENYRPFFQWELRIESGEQELSGLKLRISTLGPDRKVYMLGDWKEIGAIEVGKTKDVSYKLNCPSFQVYQAELAWNDGSDRFLAVNKESLPIPLAALTKDSYLLTLGQTFDASKPQAVTVAWMLWNLGGQKAEEVVQTISFLDEKGKAVATKAMPALTAAADSVTEQKGEFKGLPKFASISISTKQRESAPVVAVDRGHFTGAADIEIADVSTDDGKFRARVRNGTAHDLNSVIVTVSLLAADGAEVGSIDVPIAAIAAGAEQPVERDFKPPKTWAGFALSWKSADQPPSQPAGSVEAGGLVFRIERSTSNDIGMVIAGVIANQRKDAWSGNLLFSVSGLDDAGAPKTVRDVKYKLSPLDADATRAIEIPAKGLRSVTALEMKVK